MNSRRDATRANWIALFAGMFLLLAALLALIYVFIIMPELARRVELRRQQRIAEVIERHGGSVEWIGVDYGGLLDIVNLGPSHLELMPTAVFANPDVDLFSSSKPKQPEKKTPAHLVQRSPFKGNPELFAAIAELDPDTIYFNRTDFDSADFAQLRGLKITTFHASETLLDDRAADSVDCFGPYLQHAGLEYSLVGDKFIEKLSAATHIISINLEGTRITGQCAAFLSREPNLEHLNLSHTDFDDSGLALLDKCTSLKHLDISHTKVSARGLADFKPPPRLVHLEVAGLDFPEEAYKWVLDKQIELKGHDEPATNAKK